MKGKHIFWIAVVVVVIGAGYYFFGGSATPKGQPPLTRVNSQNISQLKAAFNNSAASTRVLLMLSPT